jgi:hypothetical protein
MTTGAAKRIDGIDFWHGFALLTIFIDHGPANIFQQVTQGNFGFSDAAELFVFLSGASVALAYGSRFFRGETAAATSAIFRRAFTLYWVQVLTSLLTISIFAAAALIAEAARAAQAEAELAVARAKASALIAHQQLQIEKLTRQL